MDKKNVLIQKIVGQKRQRDKFVDNLEKHLDGTNDADVWNLLMASKKQKVLSDIFSHLPKDQQVNILMSYLSKKNNVEQFASNMKTTVLRDIFSATPSERGAAASVPTPKRTKKRKVEIYHTITGAPTLGNLNDLDEFFFGFNNADDADKTQNSFMGNFMVAHENEKMGITPARNNSIIRYSVSPKKGGNSIPGISLSIMNPSTPILKKGILFQYMISSPKDAETWKSIVGKSAPKGLVANIRKEVTKGDFPSAASYNDRLLALSKSAFVKVPPMRSKNVSEKCSVLENEMKIAQNDMSSSFEFCLTVYVLYKLMNLYEPRVRII